VASFHLAPWVNSQLWQPKLYERNPTDHCAELIIICMKFLKTNQVGIKKKCIARRIKGGKSRHLYSQTIEAATPNPI
jgi:hypothetical protein